MRKIGDRLVAVDRRFLPRLWRAGIWFYQTFLSALFRGSCRYVPSCSQYSLEAVERYGASRGLWMTVGRLARCHPFRPGGFDPVP